MEIIIYVPRVRPIQRVDVRHASRDILEPILMNPTRHTNVNRIMIIIVTMRTDVITTDIPQSQTNLRATPSQDAQQLTLSTTNVSKSSQLPN